MALNRASKRSFLALVDAKANDRPPADQRPRSLGGRKAVSVGAGDKGSLLYREEKGEWEQFVAFTVRQGTAGPLIAVATEDECFQPLVLVISAFEVRGT
jgi:hypothetical protein